MNIVIVDDAAADRAILRRLLRASDRELELHEAGTACEGMRACRQFSPDCVLVDYKLPGVTGLDFLRQLRAGGSIFVLRFSKRDR